MKRVECVFKENFESVVTKFRVQCNVGRGKLFEAVSDIETFRVVGRKLVDPNYDSPLGQNLFLVPEPDNHVDKNAIAVYRGDTRIGYVPRVQTDEIRALASKPNVFFYNSNHHIFAVTVK
jgi:hypothetical protein